MMKNLIIDKQLHPCLHWRFGRQTASLQSPPAGRAGRGCQSSLTFESGKHRLIEKSPLRDRIGALAKLAWSADRGDARASWASRGIMMVVLILGFLSFNLSAQSIPIVTFDSFKHYLKPSSDTVYVINFWATWCKPCVEEIPNFEKLHSTYKDKKVEVILVSLDFTNAYKNRLLPFVERNKLQSKVIMLDTEGNNDFIDKVSPSWQGTIPATTFVQGSSNTKKFFEKQFTYEQLENIVKPLIKL